MITNFLCSKDENNLCLSSCFNKPFSNSFLNICSSIYLITFNFPDNCTARNINSQRTKQNTKNPHNFVFFALDIKVVCSIKVKITFKEIFCLVEQKEASYE